jgi:hypothetical protein
MSTTAKSAPVKMRSARLRSPESGAAGDATAAEEEAMEGKADC